MTAVDWAFDGVLAVIIPVLAWRALASDDLPKTIVIFVAMGLVSTIGWARLEAPDIALVEAAVGTGLTGALLMNALGWIPADEQLAPGPQQRGISSRVTSAFTIACALAVAGVLGIVLVQLPEQPGLAAHVLERGSESGARHPVTAVLLDFRGYDTFLEIAVLLVAALTARIHAPAATAAAREPLGALADTVARLLGPGIVLVAAYLVWRGADAPGGAFQAAAVLGGGGILFVLARIVAPPRMSSRLVRVALVAGFTWFLVVAAAPLVVGQPLLAYPNGWAESLLLSIELGLTVSIALVLVMFFPGEAPRQRGGARGKPEDRW